VPGRFKGYEARDYEAYPSFSGYPEWSSGYLSRSEWKDRIDYLNSIKGQPIHWHKKRCKIKNQKSTNYCWAFGTVSAVETAYAMSGIAGLELNAHAVAYRGKRGRNRGGFGLECCKLIQEAGIPETKDLPEFTRALSWSSELQKEASKHRLHEFEELPREDSFEAVVSALIGNKPSPTTVAFSWWRHLVVALGVAVTKKNQFGLIVANSWGTNWSLGGETGGYGIIWDKEGKADPFEAIAIKGVKAVREKQ